MRKLSLAVVFGVSVLLSLTGCRHRTPVTPPGGKPRTQSVTLERADTVRLGSWLHGITKTPDGRILAIFRYDYQSRSKPELAIYGIENGRLQLLGLQELHEGFIRAFAVSPDGQQLVVAYGAEILEGGRRSARLALFDLTWNRLLKPCTIPNAHSDDVDVVAYAPTGAYLFTASYGPQERTIKIWRAHGGKESTCGIEESRSINMGYSDKAFNLGLFTVTPDNVLLGERRFIDALNAMPLKIFSREEQPVSSKAIAVSGDYKVLAMAGIHALGDPDGRLSVFDVQSPREPELLNSYTLGHPYDYFTAVAVNGDGTLIAAGTTVGSLFLYNPQRRAPLFKGKTGQGGVEEMLFLENDGYLVVGSMKQALLQDSVSYLQLWRVKP